MKEALTRKPFENRAEWRLVPRFPSLDRFFGDRFPVFDEWMTPWGEEEKTWLPAMDIEERDDAFLVSTELPGLKREDVELDLEGNVLTVHGHRIFEEEKKGRFHRRERSWGEFHRRVMFPTDVSAKGIHAAFENGVLTVTVPKAEPSKTKKIEIH